MKKHLCTLAFSVLLLLLGVIHPVAGESIPIDIIVSGDLHGECAVIAGPLKERITLLRHDNPSGVLYLDAGDLTQGTRQAEATRGAAVIQAMNQVGCDAWVIGNHDTEYGIAQLAENIRNFHAVPLGANLHFPEAGERLQPFAIFERHGVRIAVIGLCLANMEQTTAIAPEQFHSIPSDPALASAITGALQDNADVIVLLRHAGIYSAGENLFELLVANPEIDLSIGAHTHQLESGRAIAHSWHVQSAERGRQLIRVQLEFDEESRRIEHLQSEPLDLPQPPPAPAPTGNPAPAFPRSPLSPEQQTVKTLAETLAVDLFSRSFSSGALRTLKKLAQNSSPTEEDYFASFPYFDSLGVLTVSATEAQTILQECVSVARERHETVAAYNWHYQLDEEQSITIVLARQQGTYRLALSSFQLAGASGRMPQTREIAQRHRAEGRWDGSLTSQGSAELLQQSFRAKASAKIPPKPQP